MPVTVESHKDNTFILITQCLQNGFFLSDDGRLALPRDVVARMLVGRDQVHEDVIGTDKPKNRRSIKRKDLEAGPLYSFLRAIVEADNVPSNVHVVNIRDWHAPSDNYDHERSAYGIHCEAGTWDAEYLQGFESVLAPWMKYKPNGTFEVDEAIQRQAQSVSGYAYTRKNDKVTFYDVRSDSVFDFRTPSSLELRLDTLKALYENEFGVTEEQLLVEYEKSEPDASKRTQAHFIAWLEKALGDEARIHRTVLSKVLDNLIVKAKGRVYVVVIGVYTDIKVKTLVMGLRSRYPNINGLVVSDVLTASPSYERHMEALDYFDKVLSVEVVHSLRELVHVLEPFSQDTMDADLIRNQLNFNDYKTFFRDKQAILSDQNTRLLQYIELTSRRSKDVYETITKTNEWLIFMGKVFLWVTLGLGVLKFLAPAMSLVSGVSLDFPLEVVLVTGGLSVSQLLVSFFGVPQAALRNNINSLVRLRNYLETYSTVTSLLRFYMTKLESLNFPLDAQRQAHARAEFEMVEKRINLILSYAQGMSRAFQGDIPLGTSKPTTATDAPTTPSLLPDETPLTADNVEQPKG
jgi:nicotinamidase-related amidase